MTWFTLAIAAAMLYAIIHLIDEHCMDAEDMDAWTATTISALVTLLLLLVAAPIYLPWVDFSTWRLSPSPILASVVSGVLVTASHFLYFRAIQQSDAGIVAAYWNLIPAFVLVGGRVFFHERFAAGQYLGVAMLVAAAVSFNLFDANARFRGQSLLIMVGATLIQAISYLLDEYVYRELTFSQGFLLSESGIVLIGLFLIGFPGIRRSVTRTARTMRPVVRLFLLAETLYFVAILCAERAIDLGSPTLVSAMETAVPGFVFLFSLLSYRWFHECLNLNNTRQLTGKFCLVVMMVLGALLLR